MNKPEIYILKILRKTDKQPIQFMRGIQTPEEESKAISNGSLDNFSCIIARFGAFELSTLLNCFAVKSYQYKISSYITGKTDQ